MKLYKVIEKSRNQKEVLAAIARLMNTVYISISLYEQQPLSIQVAVLSVTKAWFVPEE